MSAAAQGERMKKAVHAPEVEALLRELRRYLARVQATRPDERPSPRDEREGGKD